jgi:hypothetical protein
VHRVRKEGHAPAQDDDKHLQQRSQAEGQQGQPDGANA